MEIAYPAKTKLAASSAARLQLVLGSIVILRDQLPPAALGALLDLKEGDVRATLRRLHSVINVPSASTGQDVIRLIHPSFPDFLLDPFCLSDPRSARFAVDLQQQHTVVAKHCLQVLCHLRRDMCHIEDRHLPNSEIHNLEELKTTYLPLQLQYACKHWTHHLCSAVVDPDITRLVEDFCQTRLLMWLECLSLIGSMDSAVEALQDAMRALKVRKFPMFCILVGV